MVEEKQVSLDALYETLLKVFNNDYGKIESFLNKAYEVDALSSNEFIQNTNDLIALLSESCCCEVSFSYNVKTGMKLILDNGQEVESHMFDAEELPTCLIKYNNEIGAYIEKYVKLLNIDMMKD